MQPKHHLPINLGGVKENDFAMILGYPGRTNRWMPASGIEQNVKYAYPAWVEGSKTGMDNMKKYMVQSEALNLVYASKFAGVANYWKNRQGMIDALSKFGTAKTKAAQEAKFNTWANKPENKAKYGNVVATINNYYAMTNEKSRHDNYLQQLFRTSAFGTIGRTLGRALDAYAKADATKRVEMVPAIMEMVDEMYKELYIPAEQDILAAQLSLYAKKAGYIIAPMVEKLAATNGELNLSAVSFNIFHCRYVFQSCIDTETNRLSTVLKNDGLLTNILSWPVTFNWVSISCQFRLGVLLLRSATKNLL